MICRAEKGKAHSNPSWFYSTLGKLLNQLPAETTMKILRLLERQETLPKEETPSPEL